MIAMYLPMFKMLKLVSNSGGCQSGGRSCSLGFTFGALTSDTMPH